MAGRPQRGKASSSTSSPPIEASLLNKDTPSTCLGKKLLRPVISPSGIFYDADDGTTSFICSLRLFHLPALFPYKSCQQTFVDLSVDQMALQISFLVLDSNTNT
ncbi:hypothetical protein KP509_36G033200 [Ceratopteris richardii]|uniref:Uncharacterized protein n=1 Tax=Ceratopteris richardii TaxID=49495 RepID=A0A8T2QBZ6_CERRI|nr:hypothetical protein KP509_36G032900 [Ceratopteris richardii]KAH7281151.1 hypothetical protein KP509_36G032900 [Ceratopteris richardii]KAH7281152.1 hypothetical protein KP509_36G032900 [Ceratopteris richardii]KAH7281155.1 hypothetical protein KP509_36G033200 [Ceratopteris richardii]